MNKWIKYILLFIISYIVINVGVNLYTHTSWKDNPEAIKKLTLICAKNTKSQFDNYNSDIEIETLAYIQLGKNFTDDDKDYRKFYKRCIANAIYNYTPTEYFSEIEKNTR